MDSATRMRSNGGKARARLDKAVLSEIGRKGGKARAAGMTAKQRSAAARKAVNARWKKVRAVAKKKKRGRVAGAVLTKPKRRTREETA